MARSQATGAGNGAPGHVEGGRPTPIARFRRSKYRAARTRTSHPGPFTLSTPIVPSWASTASLQNASPEAGGVVLAVLTGLGGGEFLENPLLEFFRDSAALVSNGEQDVIRATPNFDRERFLGRGVNETVTDEVFHDSPYEVGIAARRGRLVDIQPDLALGRDSLDRIHRSTDEVCEIAGLAVDRHPAFFELIDVEQLIDHLCEFAACRDDVVHRVECVFIQLVSDASSRRNSRLVLSANSGDFRS